MSFKKLRTILIGSLSISFFSFVQPVQSAPYAVVEQWNGAHHRVKRVPIDPNPIDFDIDDPEARIMPDGRWQTPESDPDRSTSDMRIRRSEMQRQEVQRQEVQRSDEEPFGNANRKQASPPPSALNPEVDAAGVRHFSNGKHFDLRKISMDQAIENTGRTETQDSPRTFKESSIGNGVDDNNMRPMHRRHRRGNPYNTTYAAWW